MVRHPNTNHTQLVGRDRSPLRCHFVLSIRFNHGFNSRHSRSVCIGNCALCASSSWCGRCESIHGDRKLCGRFGHPKNHPGHSTDFRCHRLVMVDHPTISTIGQGFNNTRWGRLGRRNMGIYGIVLDELNWSETIDNAILFTGFVQSAIHYTTRAHTHGD